jgi:hypothetical protein
MLIAPLGGWLMDSCLLLPFFIKRLSEFSEMVYIIHLDEDCHFFLHREDDINGGCCVSAVVSATLHSAL